MPSLLPAQSQQVDSVFLEKIKQGIEVRLDQPGEDIANHFILREVENYCIEDYNCLKRTYDLILTHLEGSFRHFAAVAVAKELERLAEKNWDFNTQASMAGRLAAIYAFVGNNKMRTFYQEKLLALYVQSGNTEKIFETRSHILEGRVWYLNEAAEVLPEMIKILDQAQEAGYTDFVNRWRIRIKYVCEEFGFDDEFVEQVEALEKIPLSQPLKPSEYHIAFHAASGRGDILRKEKKYDQARIAYIKALDVFRTVDKSHHDTWLCIYALFRLAKLEWERRDVAEAKKFLEEAYVIADETNMHDRAIMYLRMKAEIAEAEKNYEDAYRFTKEIMSRQGILDSLSEDLDMEKYQIQLEREQLATEKQNQALELAQRRNQLMYTIVIVVLVALLALGLFISFRKQRRARRVLVGQNALILQQAEQLKTLDAAKSRFFANVSHELRTPLTLMLGPVKTLLQENQLTEKQARLLKMARQNGQQLGQLINEILDLRKLEAGKMELHREPVSLVGFFNLHFTQFESLAERRNIEFSYQFDLPPAATGQIDPEKCRQIIYNLLANAFKFTPANGRITATVRHRDDTLLLEVADSGPGIHPDDLPHVFDRYFQTSRPDKPAEGGTGIGLALCQEYARLLGGNIAVESAPGQGAVFTVAFPLTLSEELPGSMATEDIAPVATPEPPGTFTENLPADKPTILVVEDNPDLQEYIRLILGDRYHVVTAEHGQAAMDWLTVDGGRWTEADRPPSTVHRPPSLILSDLMMPVMDGYQLLEKLKSDDATRHIPVIMLTARAEVKDKLKALRIGVDDYLTKPFDEEELLVRIENLLKNQAARRKEIPSEAEASEAVPPIVSAADREWLETFEAYVRKNLSSDVLSIPAVALEFAMSESTLLRQLKRLTGLTPIQYLLEMRLNKARQLLEDRTYDSLAKVAAESGYSDSRSFSRSFRQRFGKLPSEV